MSRPGRPRSRPAWLAGAGLAVALLGGLVWNRGAAAPEPEPAAVVPTARAATRHPGPSVFVPSLEDAVLATRQQDPTLPINHRLRGRDAGNLLKNFDLSSVYPSNVRLLRPEQEHLIHPDRYEGELSPVQLASHQLSEGDQAFASKLASDGASRSEIRQRLKERKGIARLSRYRLLVADNSLSAGETLRALVEVVDESGAAVPHSITSAQVFADPVFGSVALGPARSLSPVDGRTPVEWQAPSQDEMYWGELRLDLALAIDNENVPLVHYFQSTPFAGVEFNGRFSAEASRGSFSFEAGLRVDRPGRCVFSVLLFDDARNQPIARATHVDVLSPGAGVASFRFYGKVFHDAGFSKGRLSLRELRGDCMPHVLRQGEVSTLGSDAPNPSPEHFYVPTLALAYRTERPYAVGEFTSQPWDTPEKQRQRELMAQAQDSREGGQQRGR